MMFIIVTQDQYFFAGMEQSLPGSIQANNFNEKLNNLHLRGKRLVLLVDNRVPLKNICKLADLMLLIQKKIIITLIEVSKANLYKQLTTLFGEYITNDDFKQKEQLRSIVRKKLHNFSKIPSRYQGILNDNEKKIVQVGICYPDISKQAEIIGCSEKALYSRRGFMQKRLGLENFAQVCNFALRNNLL